MEGNQLFYMGTLNPRTIYSVILRNRLGSLTIFCCFFCFEFFFCLFGKCSKCTVFRKLNTLLVKSNFKYRRVDINSRTYITRTFPWLMKLPADRWWPVNTGPLYSGSTEVVLFRWLQGYPSLRRKRFWNDIWQMLPCNKTLENRNEDDREKCLK